MIFLGKKEALMEKWKRIHLILVLALPLCLTLSFVAQGKEATVRMYQLDLYVSNPSLVHPGRPVMLANGNDTPKEEPPKAVTEEKLKETQKEPEVKNVEPPHPSPVEKKQEETKAAEQKPVAAEEKTVKVEEKSKAVEETAKTAEEKPKAAAEEKNFVNDLKSAGFFSDIDYRGIGIIIESREGKTLMAEGDIVYLSFTRSESVSIGNKYTVFRASDLVSHPMTGKKIGRRYNIIGNIQIIDRYGRFYVAKIIEVFDSVSRGDFIRPYSKEIMEAGKGKK
jgi:hypothetical protein